MPTQKINGISQMKKQKISKAGLKSNGLKVGTKEQTLNTSQLTSYDHIRISIEYLAIAIGKLNSLTSKSVPVLFHSNHGDQVKTVLKEALENLWAAADLIEKKKS